VGAGLRTDYRLGEAGRHECLVERRNNTSAGVDIAGFAAWSSAGASLDARSIRGLRPGEVPGGRPSTRQVREAHRAPLFLRQDESSVVAESEIRVVGDLPRVTIRIDEDARIASVERLGGLTGDQRAGGARLVDDGLDVLE
jgi:hypothetical protein